MTEISFLFRDDNSDFDEISVSDAIYKATQVGIITEKEADFLEPMLESINRQNKGEHGDESFWVSYQLTARAARVAKTVFGEKYKYTKMTGVKVQFNKIR